MKKKNGFTRVRAMKYLFYTKIYAKNVDSVTSVEGSAAFNNSIDNF